MPISDQCRWIGISPIAPAENIPVTVESMPACNKVEPCAANNAFNVDVQTMPACNKVEPCVANKHFNVNTQKITPAIADLQAIESFVRVELIFTITVTGTYRHEIYTVPPGKIFYADFAASYCEMANPTWVTYMFHVGANKYHLERYAYGGANELKYLHRTYYLNEGEIFVVQWAGAVKNDIIHDQVGGYLIDKY